MKTPFRSPPGDSPKGPPPLKAKNLLDSIFRKDGSLPPANLALRGIAFTMDMILIIAVSALIVVQFTWPQDHPEAFRQFDEWYKALEILSQKTKPPSLSEMPTPPEELEAALVSAYSIAMLVSWFYFAIGEGFFKGASLGKRSVRICTISTQSLDFLPTILGILRGGIKTIAIFFFPHITIPLTVIFVAFNKRMQMGHDLICKTVVIDQKHVKEEAIAAN